MARTVPNVAPSAARTASGTSAGFGTPADKLSVLLDVTAVSGTTPSMTVTVEWSSDGTNFATADPQDSMTAVTATGRKVKTFDVRAEHFRLAWAITGTTPSFTFSSSVYG